MQLHCADAVKVCLLDVVIESPPQLFGVCPARAGMLKKLEAAKQQVQDQKAKGEENAGASPPPSKQVRAAWERGLKKLPGGDLTLAKDGYANALVFGQCFRKSMFFNVP